MKLLRPILLFLMQLLQMISGTVNIHVRPVILFMQSIKGFVFGTNVLTVDNMIASFRQTLGIYHSDVKRWVELYVHSVLEVMPDSWKNGLNPHDSLTVILRSVEWLRSINNKWLVYSYILNIATRMTILHINDSEVRFSEVQTIVQNAYVKMKLKGELPRVSIEVSDNNPSINPVRSRKSGKGKQT